MASAFGWGWLFFERIPKTDTRDTFLGNLLATIIGILFGIPIALEINRRQTAALDKQNQTAKEQERTSCRVRVLKLIKDELDYNRQILDGIIEQQKDDPKIVTYLGLKNDLWNAISASGDLQWIDDIPLLGVIADAYYYVRRVIFFEDKYFDIEFNAGVSVGQRQTHAGEGIVKAAREIRPDALHSIEQTLIQVEKGVEAVRGNLSKKGGLTFVIPPALRWVLGCAYPQRPVHPPSRLLKTS